MKRLRRIGKPFCSLLCCFFLALVCLSDVQDAFAGDLVYSQSQPAVSEGEFPDFGDDDGPFATDGDIRSIPEFPDFSMHASPDERTSAEDIAELNAFGDDSAAAEEAQEPFESDGITSEEVMLRVFSGDESEFSVIPEDGWSDEGGFTYFYRDGARQVGWVVDTTYKDFGLQRYWIDPVQGCLVFDRLISAEEAGYWAYARPEGYVVRGRYQAADGSVYLADNDGRLEDPGWLVTGAYTGGGLQRYYIDEDAHSCRIGFFEVDGNHYYGRTDVGYVVRSTMLCDGKVVSANNDGVLLEHGWLVVDAMGYSLQRYWFDDCVAATSRLIPAEEAGYWAYARPEGYVVRGRYQAADGSVYLADNDGRLEDPGWLVTGAYAGGGLQRYYIDEDSHSCRIGFFEVDGSNYYGLPGTGYVLRGKMRIGDGVLLADNDGRTVSSSSAPGWLVTDLYDRSMKRYYLDYVCDGRLGAIIGFFVVDGASYYGSLDQGYVLRNIELSGNAHIDNDGIIHIANQTGWVITTGFGQSLQRYWFKDGIIAVSRLISPDECGWWAYATQYGYVVRGKAIEDGLVYLANNDGVLESPGWLISYEYDYPMQRYYIDSDTHACRIGFFEVDGSYYLGLEGIGYVLRGNLTVAGKSYYADNDGKLSLRVHTDVETASSATQAAVNSSFIGARQVLFLPSHADVTAVALKYDEYADDMDCLISLDGVTFLPFVSGTVFDLSTARVDESSFSVLCKTSEGSSPTELLVMISAHVATMYVISDDPAQHGRSFVDGSADHSASATGRLLMVDPDGSIVYDNTLTQIKGRGNTTWNGSAKKPYQIKLDKKTDLLETGDTANKAKTWVLLANAFDSTMLRNALFDDLALDLGLSVSPDNRPVDLYYDGEYRGSYLLSEKVEVKSGRVDMYDLEAANEDANPGVDLDALPLVIGVNSFGYRFQYAYGMNTPDDYSGGYLIELDDAYYSSERCWFETSIGYFVLKAPDNLSFAEMLYISMRAQEMIGACQRNVAHLSSVIDVDSYAKVFLLNEFLKNTDWGTSSTYFFLPTGAEESFDHVFYAGPIWDADNAMGMRNGDGAWSQASYSGLFTPSLGGGSFVLNETTEQAIVSAFDELQALILVALSDGASDEAAHVKPISHYVDEIAWSGRMNYTIWDFFHLDHCIQPYKTHEQNVSYLKTWLSNRLQWFVSEVAEWPKSDVRTYATKYGGIDYALIYDYTYYLEMNPDVRAAFGNDDVAVLHHFIVYGMSEGRVASRMFNVAIYRNRYADLSRAFGGDTRSYFEHFIEYGFREGRVAV